jgi:prolyl-tRNA editing enzyme YbaK/EbsC (Cys-tRNA(Pro) deacylase)
MNPTAQHVQEVINQLGYSNKVLEFEEPTRTAEEAAARVKCGIGQIVKSLVFQGSQSKKGILVLTSGLNRVDIKKLEAITGETVKRASPVFVRENSGFSIGGIPPIGLKNEFSVLMDRDLLNYENLWAAAGTPNSVFEVKPQDLLSMSNAIIEEIKEA